MLVQELSQYGLLARTHIEWLHGRQQGRSVAGVIRSKPIDKSRNAILNRRVWCETRCSPKALEVGECCRNVNRLYRQVLLFRCLADRRLNGGNEIANVIDRVWGHAHAYLH